MTFRFRSMAIRMGLLVGLAACGLGAQTPAPAPAAPSQAPAPRYVPPNTKRKPRPAKPKTQVKKPARALVDVNSASREALMKLPGIDGALADKIIAGRPYLSKAKLVTQNVLTMKTYVGLKDGIMAASKPVKK